MEPMQPEHPHHTVHQLDYRAPADEPFPWGQFLHSSRAAALVLFAFAVAISARYRPPGVNPLGVYLVWLGGMWYVAARAYESRSCCFVKVLKGVIAVIAVAVTPFVWCGELGSMGPLAYARAYGWMCESAFGNWQSMLFIAALMIFLIAETIDLVMRCGRRGEA